MAFSGTFRSPATIQAEIQRLTSAGIPAAEARRFIELQAIAQKGRTSEKGFGSSFTPEAQAAQDEANQMRRSPSFVNIYGMPESNSGGISPLAAFAYPLAMVGGAALGATGGLPGSGVTAGAPTGSTAAASEFGAAPLFGAAPVAGAPTVGAGGALGSSTLGLGTEAGVAGTSLPALAGGLTVPGGISAGASALSSGAE